MPQENLFGECSKRPGRKIDPLVEKFVKAQLAKCDFKEQESLQMIKTKGGSWSTGFASDGNPVIVIAGHDMLKNCLMEKIIQALNSLENCI